MGCGSKAPLFLCLTRHASSYENCSMLGIGGVAARMKNGEVGQIVPAAEREAALVL